jgi:hypothetical protein
VFQLEALSIEITREAGNQIGRLGVKSDTAQVIAPFLSESE